MLTGMIATTSACGQWDDQKHGDESQWQIEEPQQPGEEPQQPGEEPQQPGEEPRQPGEEPRQPGEEPQQPGGSCPAGLYEVPTDYVGADPDREYRTTFESPEGLVTCWAPRSRHYYAFHGAVCTPHHPRDAQGPLFMGFRGDLTRDQKV